jgi:hypothetical protein
MVEVILGGSRETAFGASAAIGVSLAFMFARGPPQRYFLVLDRQGFAVRNGTIYQTCKWTDARDFRLAGVIRPPRIRFKNSDPAVSRRVIMGLGEDTLRFLLPLRDAALASLINQWRNRALAAQ